MTRGQIALLVGEDKLITSIEFNGDMYMDWYGKKVVQAFKNVHNRAEYEKLVKEFKEENFNHYNERKLTYEYNDKEARDMRNMNRTTYFDRWFSDYVYIKNITNDTITLRDYDGQVVDVPSNAVAVMCFGTLETMIQQ